MGFDRISDEMKKRMMEEVKKIEEENDPNDFRGESIHPEDREKIKELEKLHQNNGISNETIDEIVDHIEKKKRPVVAIGGSDSGVSKQKAQLLAQYATGMFNQEISRPFKENPNLSSGGKKGRKKKAGKTFGKNKKKRK